MKQHGALAIKKEKHMKKILVTGHAGFIGSALVKELIKQEYPVTGYDVRRGQDTRDRFTLDRTFAKVNPDIVIHLAALAGVKNGEEYVNEYITTNITGTKNVVDMCHKHNVPEIIFFSSSSVLGDTSDPKDEEAKYNPMSIYGSSKVAGEAIIKNSGLDYIIVRPFTVYGPDGRSDMVIYKWIDQILSGDPITMYGEGNTSRGYTHVDDLVDGVAKMVKRFGRCSGEIINLGGSQEVTINELLEIFSDVLEEKKRKSKVDYLEIPGYDIKRSVAIIDKAKRRLRWEPKRDFEESLKKILRSEIL